MDFFEQFMFDELVELYSRDSLESYEYDDIYERFTHLEHCIEVKPYLYANAAFSEKALKQNQIVFCVSLRVWSYLPITKLEDYIWILSW